MGISIPSKSNIGNNATNQQHNSVVESLQRQKAELQNRIKEVNESKDDAKTKAAEIKDLNQQIAAIDQQIQQAKVQEQQDKMQETMAKNAEKEAEKEQEENPNAGGVVMSASLSQMVYANGQTSNMKTLSQVRTQLKGEMSIANAEIKQSAASGGSTAYQMNEISGASSQLAQTEQKMAATIKNTQKIEKAVQKGIEKADEETASTDNSDVKSTQNEENKTHETDANVENVRNTEEDREAVKPKPYKPIDIVI